jgi:hypothetical protein
MKVQELRRIIAALPDDFEITIQNKPSIKWFDILQMIATVLWVVMAVTWFMSF